MKTIISLITALCMTVFSACAINYAAPDLPVLATGLLSLGGGIVVNTVMGGGMAFQFFNPADLTWNGKEVMSLSEAVIEQFYQKPAFSFLHQVETNIKAKQQIAILGKLGLLGRKYSSCTLPVNTNGITASEKFWNPEMIGEQEETCWSELKESFFIWGLKNGLQKADLTGTDFMNFLEDRYSDAMLEAAFRVAWFNDTAAGHFSDSPAGTITDGVSLDYFNIINGFWKQLFTIATNTPARHTTNLSAKNAQATYTLQEFDATDTQNLLVTTFLRKLVTQADMRLRGEANKIIVVTQSIADQYEAELESQGVDAAFVMIQKGISKMERLGVTIYAFDFWDRYIRTYQDSGSNYFLPHRAVMYTPDNLRVGLEEEANLSDFETFYDKRDMKQISRFAWSMDAKVIEDYKVQVGY